MGVDLVEPAASTGVSPSTSLERVRALRQRGVIRGYRAEVDLKAVGRPVRATKARGLVETIAGPGEGRCTRVRAFVRRKASQFAQVRPIQHSCRGRMTEVAFAW
jgi:DNA-binding Lrp family transcriptional regulator